jgi:YbbR domain-containing protein
MRKLLLDNLGLKILSAVIAVALWVYVLDHENPLVTRRVTLSVLAVGVPQGLQVMEITPDRVEVLLRGRQSVLDDAHMELARVAANLAGNDFGEHDVSVAVVGTPAGVTVESIAEPMVRVKLDTVVAKERPVIVETRGVPAEGFENGEPTVKPTVVDVRGPAAWMQRVARVVAVVDISDQSSAVQASVSVEARDQGNVRVNGLTLTPAQVEVSVPIRQVATRAVSVRPSLGTPASGYMVAKVSVEPAAVTVAGKLSGSVIDTQKIDISELRGTESFSVPLQVPEGVTVIGTSSARVTVTVAPLPEEGTSAGSAAGGQRHPTEASPGGSGTPGSATPGSGPPPPGATGKAGEDATKGSPGEQGRGDTTPQ